MGQTSDEEVAALREELALTQATLGEYRRAAADRAIEISSLVQQVASAREPRAAGPSRGFVFRQKRRILQVTRAVKRRLEPPYRYALRVGRGVRRRIAARARTS